MTGLLQRIDFWARVRRQRGTTMIEMCMVMLLMGILSIGITYIVIGLFNAQARASAMDMQLNTSSRVIDYFDSHLSSVDVGDCGLSSGGSINPVSLAGDQLVCRHEDECYRFFYVARAAQLRVASSSIGCGPISPKRGPNEAVDDGGFQLEVGDPLYDAVLDDPMMLPLGATVFPLADAVVLDTNGSTDTESASLFRFLDRRQIHLYPGPDDRADSDSSNGFYLDEGNLQDIETVALVGAIDGQADFGSAISARKMQQRFYLNR
jgi:hypothetical protein